MLVECDNTYCYSFTLVKNVGHSFGLTVGHCDTVRVPKGRYLVLMEARFSNPIAFQPTCFCNCSNLVLGTRRNKKEIYNWRISGELLPGSWIMSKIVFYFFITSTQWLCLFSSLCWTTARPLAAILPINRLRDSRQNTLQALNRHLLFLNMIWNCHYNI